MSKLEIDFFERSTPWTLVVDEHQATFFCHGTVPSQFPMPAAELLKHVTPLVNDHLLKAMVGGRSRVFRVGVGPWATLEEFLLGYGDELVSQQLKLRATTASLLAPWAIGEIVFSWESFAVPVAILLGVQWVAARVVRRASALVAASTFLVLAAVTEVSINVAMGGSWIHWVLPIGMVAVALGHWKTYRWLTQPASPSAPELAVATLVGFLALLGVGGWGYLFGGWDLALWVIAPEWAPEPDFDF